MSSEHLIELWTFLVVLVGFLVFGVCLFLFAQRQWGKLKTVKWDSLREGSYKVLYIARWSVSIKNTYLVLCEVPDRQGRATWNNSSLPGRPRLLVLIFCPESMAEIKAGDYFYVKRKKKEKQEIPAHNVLSRY